MYISPRKYVNGTVFINQYKYNKSHRKRDLEKTFFMSTIMILHLKVFKDQILKKYFSMMNKVHVHFC